MKKFSVATLIAFVGCFAFAESSQAQMIGFPKVVIQDNSSGTPATDGYITNDILIDFDGQYTGAQMLFTLDSGDMYFDASGSGIIPQNGGFFGLVPSLQWHSMVALGTDQSSTSNGDANTGPWGSPNINGNAVDLGSTASSETFDPTGADVAWGPGGTNPVFDQVDFLTTRLTLSESANADSILFLASANGVISSFEGWIEDGVVYFVPEPTSLGLAGLGLIGLITRRRRG